MILKQPFPDAKHKRVIRLSPNFAMAVQICTTLLICAVASLSLRAQDTCDSALLAPPTPKPPVPAGYISICNPLPASTNIADGTKKAIACAWIDDPPGHDGTDFVIEALRLLTSSGQPWNVALLVSDALQAASPTNAELLKAALGDPDTDGRPKVPGLSNLVDLLAKANTRGTVEAKDKVLYKLNLFSCTQYVFAKLFKTKEGKLALIEINESFTQKNKYVALRQLLEAVWKQNGEAFDAEHLEKIRAAFESDGDALAKQVAATISAPKE